MNPLELRQYTTKQAMYYGVWLGALLVLKLVAEVLSDGSISAFFSGFLTVLVPFMAYWLTLMFRRSIAIYDGDTASTDVTFGTLLRFCIYLFFFGSMILAIVQFIYYKYINPDYIAQQVASLIDTLTKYAENKQSVNDLISQIKEVGVPSASTVAIQTIWINIVVGFILGLPIAGLVKRKKL
ncbi:MAG: DUF4199 domain-containing protein [Paludibacteraceae bacterium]|nr:DUF4199 domain-containing protein [Paludibacteraceae bacterium]